VVFEHRSRRVSLQELMADRTGAERWWVGARPANPVGIALSASLVAPLLFGGPMPMDPAVIRPGPTFWIWVYRDYEWTDCRQTPWEISVRTCRHFVERSRDVSAIGPDGFIVERPDFLRGTGLTFYLFPYAEQRAAPGDPVSIACRDFMQFYNCENRSLRWGYFVKPGIFLRYQYAIMKPHQPDMRAIDDVFRTAALRFLLGDGADAR
jgi:hypothetical protein